MILEKISKIFELVWRRVNRNIHIQFFILVKLNSRIASFYRLPLVHGALIVNVDPYSPAENAGLRRGDIIEEINGNKIENPSQISSYIRKKMMVNDTVTVVINRNGRVYELPLQLEARP